ncbi:MAG: LysR family transcriptional regulator [Porticoccaceae bacterium]
MTPWDDVRYFLAVARTGSLSGAARELGVNHSTVLRRINAYEEQQGVRLFERLPTGYALTQAAENIHADALEIEARVRAIDRRLFGGDARLQGRLRVTLYHGVAALLMPRLEEFRGRYPGIDLELLVTTDVRDLSAREADIAVRGTAAPPDQLIGRKVADFRHGLYTSPAYEARAPAIPEVIQWRDEVEIPAWVEQHCPGARVALRVDDVETMAAAVREGLGRARLPCWVADRGPGLLRLPAALPLSPFGLWILVHADLRASARVRAGRDFLIEVFAAHRDLIAGKRSVYL